jgi:hypothetical protein
MKYALPRAVVGSALVSGACVVEAIASGECHAFTSASYAQICANAAFSTYTDDDLTLS